MKHSLTTNQINELSLGLNEEFGDNEGAIAHILEELKICVKIGVCEEDGGVEEKKGEMEDSTRYFPCFTDRLCYEGHEGMRSGIEVVMEGGERVVGRRYQISDPKFMFVPGFFPSLFAEIISSFKHVVGCEIWRDCLKVQVSGGLIVRLEIVEREPFFDLSVMKKEMKMVGEVEDEVFGLLNRVDLMIMNKLRGEMRDGVSKRCVHPESLKRRLFLEGGEILDRNHVEYDEEKEDENLLGSGLDGFEYDLERSERGELRLILRSQISSQLEAMQEENKVINEETQFILENAQNQQHQSHQQIKQDYNSISNQVIDMMDELEGLREWMEEDQKEGFQTLKRFFVYQKEKERKIEEKKKRNERRMKEEKIQYRSQKIHEITDHYNNNNSSGVVDENQSQSSSSLYHDQSSLTSSTRRKQLKDDTGSNEDEGELRRSARKRTKKKKGKRKINMNDFVSRNDIKRRQDEERGHSSDSSSISRRSGSDSRSNNRRAKIHETLIKSRELLSQSTNHHPQERYHHQRRVRRGLRIQL